MVVENRRTLRIGVWLFRAVGPPGLGRLDVPQFGVKAVAEPVAQQVHGEHGEYDG